jgi:FkbM family methyltransferase
VLTQLGTFLNRPDVRQRPVRLLARRIHLGLLDRFRPHLLRQDRVFQVSDGYRVQLPLDDDVARELYVHGAFEFGVGRQILKAAESTGTIIDVGAQFGTFTLLAARRLAGRGRVLAVEPNPVNRSRLDHHIELNRLQAEVLVVSDAVLDCEMETTIGSPSPENSGMSQLGVPGTVVKCRRLDDVVADLNLQQVSLIKIDVEGVEVEVLRGAADLIRRDQPSIIAELNDRRVVTVLEDEFHYTVKRINEDGTLSNLPSDVHCASEGTTVNILGVPSTNAIT